MSEVTGGQSKLKAVFTWGGVFFVLLGLFFLVRGQPTTGLLVAVAGVVSWLFAKRRSRRTTA